MLVVVLSLYVAINYYIGWHGWHFLSVQLGFQYSVIYWIVFGFVALSYMIARLGSSFIPNRLLTVMRLIGSYWFAIMVYALFLLLIGDLVIWLLSWTRLDPTTYQLIISCIVLFTITVI